MLGGALRAFEHTSTAELKGLLPGVHLYIVIIYLVFFFGRGVLWGHERLRRILPYGSSRKRVG